MSSWARLGIAIIGAYIGGSIAGPFGAQIGFATGTMLGSYIFPTKSDLKMPKLGNYPVQASNKGQPIAIEYGTTEMAGNVVWMGPLQTVIIKHQTGGGKGGGSTTTTEEIQYKRSFFIGVCEGQRSISRIRKGKKEIPLSSATIFEGDGSNSGLAALIGEEYANYKWLCGAYFEEFLLGNTPTIPNFVFEVTQTTPYGGYYVTFSALYRFGTNYVTINFVEPPAGEIFTGMDNDDISGRILASIDKPDPTSEPWYVHSRALVRETIVVEEIAGWADWVNTSVFNACFSGSGDYVYAVWRTTVAPIRLYVAKWNSRTGALEWSDFHTKQIPLVITSDSFDTVYYAVAGTNPVTGYNQAWRASDNVGGENVFTGLADDINRCIVAEDWEEGGVAVPSVFFCGRYNPWWSHPGDSRHLVWKYDQPLWNGSSWDWAAAPKAIFKYDLTTPATDNAWDIAAVDNNLFVITTDAKLFKLDSDLNEVTSIAITAPKCIFKGPGNTVCVVYVSGGEAYINRYDTDLVLLETVKTEYEGSNPSYLWDDNKSSAYSYYAAGGGDANPADVIWDLFTHNRYGANSPVAELNEATFADIRQQCYVDDFLCSFAITERKPIPDVIEYICSHFQGFIYESNGKICLGMFRDQASQFTLTQNDFVRTGSEPPIKVRKRKYSQTSNRIEMTWTNRAAGYQEAVPAANDMVDQDICGHVRKDTIDLKGIHREEMAVKMIWRVLFDSMYRFSIYSFTVGYKHMRLEVADVGTISDGGKIINEKVRIMSISEDKDGRGLTIEAVEDTSSLYPDLANYSIETTKRTADAAVTLADSSVAFREEENEAKLQLSITPSNQYTNGWYIYLSHDDSSYELVGKATIAGVTGADANSSGVLTTALAGGPGLSHRQNEIFGADIGTLTDLVGTTDAEFFRGAKLAKVEDEIIAYKNVSEVGGGSWNVSNLIRGLFHTERTAHAIGAAFDTLDVSFTYNLKAEDVGQTLYFKIVTFYGKDDIQSLSDVTADSYQVRGLWQRPAPVSLLRLTADENDGGGVSYSGPTFTLYWNLASKTTGYNQGGYDVYSGKTRWRFGDSEADLLAGSGVAYGNYVADAEIQGVDLIFEQNDGTPIGQRRLTGALESASISKADDLNNNNPAVIKVIPCRAQRSWREKSITVTQF